MQIEHISRHQWQCLLIMTFSRDLLEEQLSNDQIQSRLVAVSRLVPIEIRFMR